MAKEADEDRLVRHEYAVMSGHGWTVGLGQVLLNEYKPFLDQGFELDRIGTHFLGGQGFRDELAALDNPGKQT
jgi:hypothetical protein